MRWPQKDTLRGELRAAGATAAEVGVLLPLADSLRLLRRPGSAVKSKGRFGHIVGAITAPAAYVFTGIMVSALTIVIAQAASPGSWLFPVQKASDSVAIMLHPQYRAVVMMKRADQVKELVSSGASSKAQVTALTEYMEVANEYKNQPHANYAAFQYCESQLSQAAKSATPQIRQAINRSLYSLDTT